VKNEIELKFRMASARAARSLLKKAGARLVRRTCSEENEIFDLPDGSLKKRDVLLRLRRDGRARLTVKLAKTCDAHYKERAEIEFEVSDYGEAKRALEALGFRVDARYSKRRETWTLAGCEVELDELPFGCFLELEGSKKSIREAAKRLGLPLTSGLTAGYLDLARASRC